MPIDFNAFRSMASQSPDKAIYVSGGALKATNNTATKSVDKFQSATKAFINVCKTRYGAALADALRNHLQEDLATGKPLTARKIKALIDFADEKMGSAKSIDAGGRAIDLAKLGTDKMSRVGFGRNTKVAKAQMGQMSSATATLAAFKFGADGNVDLEAMLRHLNTFRAYIDREVSARNLSTVPAQEPMADIAGPNVARPLLPEAAGQPMRPLAPRLSEAAAETAKLFEKGLFTAIDAMDNKELSDVYQGLIAKGTDDFKKELTRIINHPDAKPSTARLAEKAFADLCRIESMVVSEISRRMILDQTPDDQKANVPSLMERYVGAGAVSASHYGNAKDMSTVNLGIVARNAAQGSNNSKVASGKVDGALKSHGMNATDARKIGDMLRAQELTVNMKFAALMGYSRTGDKKPSLFKRTNAHLVNTFESKELQGRDPLGSGDLKHRDQVEKAFFPEFATKPVKGKERPVYGALNTQKYTSGGADTYGGNYGRVVVVMKPHVKQRCTYALDDLNAVALGTAGHDTGRTGNGVEQEGSEERSADIVNAGVEKRYPGAAGDAWKEQVKANITTPSARQNTIEGYLFKSADSLDYWRVDELNEKKFPFLQTPILTSEGIAVGQNDAMRRQLMAEAKRLTELTQPRYQYKVERNQIEGELMELGPGPEFNAKNARHEQLDGLMHDSEIEQTETKTDAQIVELVENAIRDNPKDFPLLTKYYLNAE